MGANTTRPGGPALLPHYAPLDYLAVALYLGGWIGYTLIADHSRWRARSISALMGAYRVRWMRQMLRRENRMVDSGIIGNLQNGAAFFASTTILALGGLIAVLGAHEKAAEVFASLPHVEAGAPGVWQTKVLLLMLVLVHAFFKFAWSFRLHNYCSVLLGAAPIEPVDDPEAEALAQRTAEISTLAARHFNRGLRAYFFALAALAWFLHPVLFMLATLSVVFVLYRREFRSKSLLILRRPV